jgi:spore coat protein A
MTRLTCLRRAASRRAGTCPKRRCGKISVATRTFVFQDKRGGWTINGDTHQSGRYLARPRLGATEVWRFIGDFYHPVHLHLNHFQVLSRNGATPGPYDAGWKDTVDLQPPAT